MVWHDNDRCVPRGTSAARTIVIVPADIIVHVVIGVKSWHDRAPRFDTNQLLSALFLHERSTGPYKETVDKFSP
jgi:hypothetical protein